MPTVSTLKGRTILALGYKKGQENRRRYDQEFAENVKSNNASRGASAYNSAMNAYNSYLKSKERREEKKQKQLEDETDGGYFKADSASTRKAYENPSDEANEIAYKTKIFNAKRDYKMDSSKYRVK